MIAFQRWVPGVGRDVVVVADAVRVDLAGDYRLGFPRSRAAGARRSTATTTTTSRTQPSRQRRRNHRRRATQARHADIGTHHNACEQPDRLRHRRRRSVHSVTALDRLTRHSTSPAPAKTTTSRSRNAAVSSTRSGGPGPEDIFCLLCVVKFSRGVAGTYKGILDRTGRGVLYSCACTCRECCHDH